MRYKTAINDLEWLLILIVAYYLFLFFGATTMSVAKNAETTASTKILIAFILCVAAVTVAKLLVLLLARFTHQITEWKIITIYVLSLIILYALSPFTLYGLLTLVDVFPG